MPMAFGLRGLLSSVIGLVSTTAAIYYWRDSISQASSNDLLQYNNDAFHTSNSNDAPFSLSIDNHHVLSKGNWIILISTSWTPSQDSLLQWWKDSCTAYNATVLQDKDNTLKFASVDGSADPELVALLQVHEYPSIRLVTENGTHLRPFNRALLLPPTTLVHYLGDWKDNVVMWKGLEA